jgi:hypothetical protein
LPSNWSRYLHTGDINDIVWKKNNFNPFSSSKTFTPEPEQQSPQIVQTKTEIPCANPFDVPKENKAPESPVMQEMPMVYKRESYVRFSNQNPFDSEADALIEQQKTPIEPNFGVSDLFADDPSPGMDSQTPEQNALKRGSFRQNIQEKQLIALIANEPISLPQVTPRQLTPNRSTESPIPVSTPKQHTDGGIREGQTVRGSTPRAVTPEPRVGGSRETNMVSPRAVPQPESTHQQEKNTSPQRPIQRKAYNLEKKQFEDLTNSEAEDFDKIFRESEAGIA